VKHLRSKSMLYEEISYDLGNRYHVFAGPDTLDWYRLNRPPAGMFVGFTLWYCPYRFDETMTPIPPMIIVGEEGRQTKSTLNPEWSDAPFEMIAAYTFAIPYYYSIPRK